MIASGIHLFPFRTEKLSPKAPMVLPEIGGRVGSCLFYMSLGSNEPRLFFALSSPVSSLIPSFPLIYILDSSTKIPFPSSHFIVLFYLEFDS